MPLSTMILGIPPGIFFMIALPLRGELCDELMSFQFLSRRFNFSPLMMDEWTIFFNHKSLFQYNLERLNNIQQCPI